MKRIYIFDVDNTLRSSKQQKILPQTIKLIKKLAQNKNYILGIATGRGPAKIDVIDEIEQYFTFKILVNGAVILKDNKLFYDFPIDFEDLKYIVNDTMKKGLSLGMVGYDEEAVTVFDEHVSYAMKGYRDKLPKIDPNFYLNNKIYQLWLFNKEQTILDEIVKAYPKFKTYYWHYGGVDLVYPEVSKETAVKKIKDMYPDYELICIGDGHNDFGMLRLANIGIIMNNSRWINDIKDECKYIAPHIENDALYDFFESNKLL